MNKINRQSQFRSDIERRIRSIRSEDQSRRDLDGRANRVELVDGYVKQTAEFDYQGEILNYRSDSHVSLTDVKRAKGSDEVFASQSVRHIDGKGTDLYEGRWNIRTGEFKFYNDTRGD